MVRSSKISIPAKTSKAVPQTQNGTSKKLSKKVEPKSVLNSCTSSEDDDDFEDVEDVPLSEYGNFTAPTSSVEVTISRPYDLKKELISALRLAKRKENIEIHKSHVVLLLASGIYRNHVCNSRRLQAFCLSLVSTSFTLIPIKKWNLDNLTSLAAEFSSFRSLTKDYQTVPYSVDALMSLDQCDKIAYVMQFVATLRSLGLQCRLVWSPQPIKIQTFQKLELNELDFINEKLEQIKQLQEEEPKDAEEEPPQKLPSSNFDDIKNLLLTHESSHASSQIFSPNIQPTVKSINKDKPKKSRNVPQHDSEDDFKKCTNKKKSNPDENQENKSKRPRISSTKRKLRANTRKRHYADGSESEEERTSKYFNDSQSQDTNKKVKKSRIERESENVDCTDSWVEVYLEKFLQWICVCPVQKVVYKPFVIGKNATQPISYVWAFSNRGTISDVTKRYSLNWAGTTSKIRLDYLGGKKKANKPYVDWYNSLLASYTTIADPYIEKESQTLDHWKDLPMPASKSQYKNHPLYALEAHFLKYEGLKPNTKPICKFKDANVYPRSAVCLLHTKETWLKEAMQIKADEIPAKFVKSVMPKSKAKLVNGEAPDVPLYGPWQVEDYVAPPVVDGRIPRNTYGNVEMFKESMLPPGGVWLKDYPGLDKIAKSLDVDCAQAMVGWEFGTGWHAIPMFNGFIVCEENAELLKECWHAKREEEAHSLIEQRVLRRWTRLTRRILIANRLNALECEGPLPFKNSGEVL